MDPAQLLLSRACMRACVVPVAFFSSRVPPLGGSQSRTPPTRCCAWCPLLAGLAGLFGWLAISLGRRCAEARHIRCVASRVAPRLEVNKLRSLPPLLSSSSLSSAQPWVHSKATVLACAAVQALPRIPHYRRCRLCCYNHRCRQHDDGFTVRPRCLHVRPCWPYRESRITVVVAVVVVIIVYSSLDVC